MLSLVAHRLRAFFAQGTSRDWRTFCRFWLGWGLIAHGISAIYSVGFHSADEYFQILEFASYKLGLTPQSVLAVEFPERMRPWLLPALVTQIVRALQALGVENPFHWAIVLRACSSLLGWVSTVALAVCLPLWLPGRDAERLRRWTLLGLVFLWYLPALHARPSSESWGGSWFVLGACALYWSVVRHAGLRGFVLAGLGFGLAFESRFQMGIAIAGASAWALWQRLGDRTVARARVVQEAAALLGAFAAIFILGRAIDAWGYGEWVLSPWRYVQYNLIRNEVNRYGASPWWDVFRMATTEAWPVIGLLSVVAFVLAWVRNPRHLLTWSLAPFFVVHCAIAHKELRFFFPIASAGPVLIALALRDLTLPLQRPLLRGMRAGVVGLLLALNASGFATALFAPMSRNVLMWQAIWQRAPQELHVIDKDPFEVLGTATFFYRPRELRLIWLKTPPEAIAAVERASGSGARFHLFHTQLGLPATWEYVAERCAEEFQTLPWGARRLMGAGWLPRANAWSLRICPKQSPSPH